MKKLFLSATSVLALATGAALAQAPAGPTFEVASIKAVPMPNAAQVMSGKLHAGMKIDAARVDIGLYTLMQLICKAYDVKEFQVQAPGWLNNGLAAQRFDVIAKMPDGANKDQVPQMLQALLADRFKVVIHKEKKEQSVYALVQAKGGAKLKESEPIPTLTPAEGGPTAASSGSNQVSVTANAKGAVVSDGEGTQQKMTMGQDGKMHMDISGATISKLAEGLGPLLDRPVIDMTELKGRYDIALAIPIQELMAAAKKMGVPVPDGPGGGDAGRPADAASDPSGSSLFQNLQAVGLKLEPRKLPFDIIVIDKAEKLPSDN